MNEITVFMGVIALFVLFVVASKKALLTTPNSYKDSTLNLIQNKYGTYIDACANRFKVPRNIIMAIIAQESGGNENIQTGEAGEIGLMQITNGALLDFNETYGSNFSYPNDLKITYNNILVGTGYFAYLYSYFRLTMKKTESDSLVLSSASYNAGITGCLKYGYGFDYYKKIENWINKIYEV